MVTIRLPPLRERGDDLQLLAEHFLRRFSRELGKEVDRIAPEALDLLKRYSWPGSVRELQSVLKQAILQTTGPVLVPEILPASIRGENPVAVSMEPNQKTDLPDLAQFVQERLRAGAADLYGEFQTATERQLFLQVLRHTGNNLTHAAHILGISRATLRNKLGAHKIVIDRSSSVEEEDESV